MSATKKSVGLAEKGIEKPSSEQKRSSDSDRASQQKRDAMGTKKPKDEFKETSLDHPQHAVSEYKRSHTDTSFGDKE